MSATQGQPLRAPRPSQAARVLLYVTGSLCGCVLCLALLLGQHEWFWWNQRRLMQQAIRDNVYPGAALVEEKSLISLEQPGNVCWAVAYGTYQAEGRFRDVREWYAAHTAGLSFFADGTAGLDRVARDREANTVVFRVMKRVEVPTLICPEW